MKQKQTQERMPSNILSYFHLMDIRYLFQLASSQSNISFPLPTFSLFKHISERYSDHRSHIKLVKNILYQYRQRLLVGIILTVIASSINLYLSLLIQDFIEVMQEGETSRTSNQIVQIFIILQFLRVFFSTHIKKIFLQLAIQIQSSLAQKLVEKTLSLSSKERSRIQESQLYHYENVDLNHIYLLSNSLHLAVEIPFTIIIAIFLLFRLNVSLGFITVFWFTGVFLLQGMLASKMSHCNLTKHSLIEKRAKFNYQFMQKIKEARIVHAENIMIEKNNDLFIEECHDHLLFYRYSSIFEILQLLLPLAVCCTSLVYDKLSERAVTFEELYFVLSLLGICYRPMRKMRSFHIAVTDGIHSLERISQFFNSQDQQQNPLFEFSQNQQEISISIAQGTKASISNRFGEVFSFETHHHLEIKAGQRIVLLGKRGNGSSTFLRMVSGFIPLSKGKIIGNGKIAYFSEENMIIADSLYSNLSLFDKNVSRDDAEKICESLSLFQEIYLTKGIDTLIQPSKCSETQLKLIALARMLCSKAPIYILDRPFTGLPYKHIANVEEILRKRQKQGVIVILALLKVEELQPKDRIIIIEGRKTKQVGFLDEMMANPDSNVKKYVKKTQELTNSSEQHKILRQIIKEFQDKVRKSLICQSLTQRQLTKTQNQKNTHFLFETAQKYSRKLHQQDVQKQAEREKSKLQKKFRSYFWKFLKTCKPTETALILIIILAAELLHIFIHFFIGHEYEHHEKEALDSMVQLMSYEVVLTFGLAAVIYLEGQVSSYLAIITGNKLYKQSLESLTHKEMNWYNNKYLLRQADKFNHDFQEIFIFIHQLLGLYKNVVILIITAFLVGGSNGLVLLTSLGVALLYLLIWKVQRSVRNKAFFSHFFDVKYDFVKVFSYSIEGHQIIRVHQVQESILDKAKEKYAKLASYKAAKGRITRAEIILCQIVAILVTAEALKLGTMQGDKKSISAAATSILLLMNLSYVLRSILKTAIEGQKFFRLNILPFMKAAPILTSKQNIKQKSLVKNFNGYDLNVTNLLAREPSEDIFNIHPFSLKIPEGQSVCLYDEDDILRANLLYGLTSNLFFKNVNSKNQNQVTFGGLPIDQIDSSKFNRYFGVIMDKNFFFSGTLQDNLKWQNPNYEEKLALELSKKVRLEDQLKNYKEKELKSRIQVGDEQTNGSLSKIIALIRTILFRSKIVILMDTHHFIKRWNITELLRKYNPGCTIIQITKSLETAYDVDRIILFEHLKKIQEGNPAVLQKDELSKIGQMLRMCDKESFIYRYRQPSSPSSPLKRKSKNMHEIKLMVNQLVE